jgi:hypothetical protein
VYWVFLWWTPYILCVIWWYPKPTAPSADFSSFLWSLNWSHSCNRWDILYLTPHWAQLGLIFLIYWPESPGNRVVPNISLVMALSIFKLFEYWAGQLSPTELFICFLWSWQELDSACHKWTIYFWRPRRSAAPLYVMKSDFVKGRQQLL